MYNEMHWSSIKYSTDILCAQVMHCKAATKCNAVEEVEVVEEGMWGKLLNHNLPTAGLLSAAFFVCLFVFLVCFSLFVCLTIRCNPEDKLCDLQIIISSDDSHKLNTIQLTTIFYQIIYKLSLNDQQMIRSK